MCGVLEKSFFLLTKKDKKKLKKTPQKIIISFLERKKSFQKKHQKRQKCESPYLSYLLVEY